MVRPLLRRRFGGLLAGAVLAATPLASWPSRMRRRPPRRHALPYEAKARPWAWSTARTACAMARSRSGRTPTSCRPSTSPGRASTSTPAPLASLAERAIAADRAQPGAQGAGARGRSSASTATPTTRSRQARRGGAQALGRRLLRGLPRPGGALDRVARRARRDPRRERERGASIRPTSRWRARACACRATSATRTGSSRHRMMGAGHPRMSFELDTFTQTEPGALQARRRLGEAQGRRGTA